MWHIPFAGRVARKGSQAGFEKMGMDPKVAKGLGVGVGVLVTVATFDVWSLDDVREVIEALGTDVPAPPGIPDSPGTGDAHFGSSGGPVCFSCGGTGRSSYPSSGTTGVCFACGGTGF